MSAVLKVLGQNPKRGRPPLDEDGSAIKRLRASSSRSIMSLTSQMTPESAVSRRSSRLGNSKDLTSNGDRDSGFFEAMSGLKSPSPRPSLAPSSAQSRASYGSHAFHDAVQARELFYHDSARASSPVSATPHGDTPGAPSNTILASGEIPASQTDEEYQDALDEPIIIASLAKSSRDTVGKTIYAGSLTSNATEPHCETIVVPAAPSEKQEQVIHASAPRQEAHHDTTGDKDGDEDDKTPNLAILRHRITREDEVELLVQQGTKRRVWVAEDDLQETALDDLNVYWESQQGGRLASRKKYEVYKIRHHEWLHKGKSKKKSLFLVVEWLGYKDTSSEPWRQLSEDQPLLVQEYFASIGGRPQDPDR